MPGGDGTGPIGIGQRTGRRMGFCNGYNSPGFANFGFGFRQGMGMKFGQGMRFRFNRINEFEPIQEKPTTNQELENLEQDSKQIEKEQQQLKNELESVQNKIKELKEKNNNDVNI
jgi:uncharacterized protein DUF5320